MIHAWVSSCAARPTSQTVVPLSAVVWYVSMAYSAVNAWSYTRLASAAREEETDLARGMLMEGLMGGCLRPEKLRSGKLLVGITALLGVVACGEAVAAAQTIREVSRRSRSPSCARATSSN
jgi:hypothetical protein